MSADEYIDLTGDELPYHLRPNVPPLAQCDRCGRQVWSAEGIGTIDQMPQPNGDRCGGRLLSLSAALADIASRLDPSSRHENRAADVTEGEVRTLLHSVSAWLFAADVQRQGDTQ